MGMPYLGLGLSSNAQQGDVPRPYRLLDETPGLFDFLEYSAPLDLDEARGQATLLPTMLERRHTTPLLYHPVHLNLWGPLVEPAERLQALAQHVETVGSPWVSNDIGWWHHHGAALPGYLYLTPPLDAVAVENAALHARTVRQAVSVPVLLENPVVMAARGRMHVLEFMTQVADQSGCGLLLDIGHLLSHQLARGLALTEGLSGFDFSRVSEVHIAGGVITSRAQRQVYVDDHPQPIRDEVWALLGEVLPQCTKLRALTYEGDGHPDPVAKLNLVRLRSLLAALPPVPPDVPAPTAPNPSGLELPADDAWRVFDEVHRGESTEDPAGATAELDYRLAVLAQTLDAAVPLTRVTVAPSRDALARFAASDAFRDWFEHGASRSKEVADAFVTWAAHELRRRTDPLVGAAEALVSLEAWARQQARKLGDNATMQATFPLCLTEALHAARSLQRHLTAKAWWNDGGVEPSGLSGLSQAAGRATKGPWAVTLKRVGARVEVTG